MLRIASKLLKLVALLGSTNVLVGWISLQCVLPVVPNFLDGTFTDFILPPQRPLARCVQLAQLCNSFTWLGFGQTGCLRFHLFPIAFVKSEGLESNMSKVHTYQLSAHQRLWLKVHTQAGYYYTKLYYVVQSNCNTLDQDNLAKGKEGISDK